MPIFRVILTVLAVAYPAPGGPSPTTAQADESSSIQGLIRALGDPDPARRSEAADDLRRRGEAARPALVLAARGEDLAIAPTASAILVSMPWYRAGDPPAIRQALQTYARPDPPLRIDALRRIVARYPRPIANRVLDRLLMEEPSEEVCWQIVAMLRTGCDEQTHRALRELDPQPQTRASVLVLAARSCFVDDRPRAHELLRKAIDIETRYPTWDGGELDFAFDALAGAAIVRGDYEEAAALRRSQTFRTHDSSDPSMPPVYDLFALHARFGPLKDFQQDLRTYSVYLADPQVMYSIAAAYRRAGQDAAEIALTQAAYASSLTSRRRGPVADFLRRQRCDGLLSMELSAIAAGQEPTTLETRRRAMLVQIDMLGRHNLHGMAAERLRAVEAMDRLVRGDAANVSDYRAMIAWRQFRDAHARDDQAEAGRHLAALLSAKSWNTDVATDMVPYLKSIGRDDDARRMFDREYREYQRQLQQTPHNPMMLNSLAWLCARSGEHAEEALFLANRAVEGAPGEAAFLDTLAEAHHQAGNAAEAVRLERAVIELEPFDPFMIEQLERFSRGKRD